jgi:hypothetical protein
VVRWVAALLIALSGCRKDRCDSDEDCPVAGSRCDTEIQRCVCVTEAACGEGEFCNSAGICQRSLGCESNVDCPQSDTFCETGSGRCLFGPALEVGSPCSVAGQCPFGAICVDLRCAPGCYDHGDCPLGELCREGECRAEAGACLSTDFCPYGNVCEEGACRDDARGAYCSPCETPTLERPSPCGPEGSLCIINSYGPGPEMFCGVDCSDDYSCPSGYVCSRVATLTDVVCAGNQECGSRSCMIGEGRTSGFCACTRDEDCPLDECDPEVHICRRTGVGCDPAGPPCPTIACESGACTIGLNCVPAEGLYCDLLR